MKNIKSYLLMFILGGICFSGIGAFAEYIVTADKIEYATNVSVKDKIDDLYTHVKPAYSGSVEVTPTKSKQTLSTNGKILNSNITINKIPDSFQDISASTVTSASDILSGRKAYLSNGTLVTGTRKECVTGTYNHAINTQVNISIGFKPTQFYMVFNDNWTINYNTDYNNKIRKYNPSVGGTALSEATEWHVNSSGIYTDATAENAWYNTAYIGYYVACK